MLEEYVDHMKFVLQGIAIEKWAGYAGDEDVWYNFRKKKDTSTEWESVQQTGNRPIHLSL